MIELADIQPILAEQRLPEATAMHQLSGGHALVLRLDLADQTTVLLKSFPIEHTIPHHDAYAAQLLGELSLPITKFLLIDESLSRLPFRFAITSYLDGERAYLFAAHPGYQKLMQQLGALARKLHSVRLPTFGDILAEGRSAQHSSNVDYMRGYVDGSFARFADQGGDPVMAATLRKVVERDFDAVVSQSGPPVFAHSDLQPHNILAIERAGELQLTGLIDFGNARAESASMDLAKTIFCTEHDSPGSTASILAGYGPVEHPEAQKALAFYTILHRLTMWWWLRHTGILPSPDTPSDIVDALQATAAST